MHVLPHTMRIGIINPPWEIEFDIMGKVRTLESGR